ncbi:acyltransferase family protein [Faunimonas sp. B44]|uniref:acyltransferase family protein n=1 Tax=Faunimonas sp. B44 TaxID=3461493 RepID=UPI00404417B8
MATDRRVLGPYLDPDRNAFNLVRLAAALCVIVSHAFVIVGGRGTAQPLALLTPFTLGQHAVNVFFVISGLTVAASLDRTPDVLRFIAHRCLRIFPALLAFGLVFAFAIGPFVTGSDLATYFGSADTLGYPFAVPVLLSHAPGPEGVFLTTPLAGAVNVPLWTIEYELLAYAGLATLFALGLLRNGRVLVGLIALCAAALVGVKAAPDILRMWSGALHPPLFGLTFLLGVAAYRWRDRVVLSPWLLALLLVAAVALGGTAVGPVAYVALAAYGALYLGTLPMGALARWTRRTDISYGTYIYGWPVQQTLVVIFPGWGLVPLMCAALAAAPLAGFLSWSLVERRALALKKRLPAFRTAAAAAS